MDREGRHIPDREGKGIVGNIKYCSIRVGNGQEASRRDDLESACYLVIYLMKKELPWLKVPYSKHHSILLIIILYLVTKEEYYEKV